MEMGMRMRMRMRTDGAEGPCQGGMSSPVEHDDDVWGFEDVPNTVEAKVVGGADLDVVFLVKVRVPRHGRELFSVAIVISVSVNVGV